MSSKDDTRNNFGSNPELGPTEGLRLDLKPGPDLRPQTSDQDPDLRSRPRPETSDPDQTQTA
ncbi:hypothetical protein WMY93_015294 [Mugilogobius chulae]|uniref:Uncharacterized protein n=1 Tax=Mugilogobius chulae TaxID=88201 RepID=A0AAW0NSE5_9GOBI